MDACHHKHLTILASDSADRVRCRRCHLTIRAADLGAGPCPECLEASGTRHRDFEPVPAKTGPVRYRCEDCGAMM